MKNTSIEPVERCSDYGQFRREFVALHDKTGAVVRGRADIPDTHFSIPATTDHEHGFLMINDEDELIDSVTNKWKMDWRKE